MLVGETGIGKNSVVNLIVGEDITRDSPDAEVCTHRTTRYEATMESMKMHIWEGSGFDQPKKDPEKNAPDIEEKFRPILEAKASVNVVLFYSWYVRKIHSHRTRYQPLGAGEGHGGLVEAKQEQIWNEMSGTRHVCVTGLRDAGHEGKWRELREKLVAVLSEYGPSRGRTAVPLEPALRDYLDRSGQTDRGLVDSAPSQTWPWGNCVAWILYLTSKLGCMSV